MGIARRLATEGNADTAPGIGPKGVAVDDAGTKTSNSQVDPDGVAITQENEFHTETAGRFDARGNQVQLITLTGFTGTDEFTLTGYLDGALLGTTIAFTRGTDAAAADIQTALRSLFAGTDLTVVSGTTDEGPFTVTFNDDEFFSRHFPKLTVQGTGCTGVVTAAGTAVRRYLGETKYESTTELVGPVIGTITPTAAVDEVQSFAFSAGTDGGTYRLGFRRGTSGDIAFDADGPTLQAEVDAVFELNAPYFTALDAPTVALVTPLNMEINFVDWDTTDDAILTHTSGATDSIEFAAVDAGASAAAREAIIATWVQTIDGFEDYTLDVTEVVENFEYDVVFLNAYGLLAADFSLAVTGTVNEDQSPDQNVAFSADAGWTFTFENGALAGRPIRGGFQVREDSLLDGVVEETGTLAVDTAGVLGSASAAYTEQATVGDSVFVEARNDATGRTYGAQKDAASPAVISGLPPGVYTLVCRTVADKSLSAPTTKAFTVTSA